MDASYFELFVEQTYIKFVKQVCLIQYQQKIVDTDVFRYVAAQYIVIK